MFRKVMRATTGPMTKTTYDGKVITQTNPTNKTVVAIVKGVQTFLLRLAFLHKKKKAVEKMPRADQIPKKIGTI
jgi:hypothetical protein